MTVLSDPISQTVAPSNLPNAAIQLSQIGRHVRRPLSQLMKRHLVTHKPDFLLSLLLLFSPGAIIGIRNVTKLGQHRKSKVEEFLSFSVKRM